MNLRRLKLLALPTLAAILCILSSCRETVEINAADYGLREGADNTPALMRALEACKAEKASRLVIPKGVYDLYPDRAHEQYRNISNNDDGRKRIVFLLDGFRNFEIDGNGSAFVCHEHMLPFDVSNSEGVTLKNFSVDWKSPFYLQGQVVAVHPEQNAFDLKILDECNWEIQGQRLIFSNKKGPTTINWWFMAPPMQKDAVWYQNVYWNIWYDPSTKAPSFCNEGPTRVSEWNFRQNKPSSAADLGGNTVRLTDACDELPRIGWVLVCSGVLSPNRLSPAIHLTHSKNLRVENVTVHHASGMALVAERCENVTLDRYNVLLPENSERLVTTTADASHFVGCKGLITLENCIFENMLDDGTNVHGVYAEVREAVGPRTLGMSRGHSQQQGFDFAAPGETVALVDRQTLRPYDTLTVTSVKNVNDYYFEVTFDQRVEDRLKGPSVAENRSCQPDVVMRGCEVRQNRARGILISTAGKVLVEDNKFVKCTYAGIQTAGDANYWFESGPVADLTVRGNLFEDQGLVVGNAPILAIVPEVGNSTADTSWQYHSNILVENNTINAFSRILVQARSIRGFVFRGNTVNRAPGYPAANPAGPVFVFEGCRDVLIDDNDYNWGPEATIVAGGGCANIRSANNRNIETLDIK